MGRRVVILGGGLTGLSCAWRLVESGFQVTVLEKEKSVGGLSSSVQHKGYVFDYGPHGFHSGNEALLKAFRELVPDCLRLEKSTEIYWRKKYFHYPLRLGDMVSTLPVALTIQAFFTFLEAGLRRSMAPRPEISARDWLVNHFGRTLHEQFFGPFTEKVWGLSTGELAADFVADRVPHASLWGVIKQFFAQERAVARTPSGRRAYHDVAWSLYPPRGIHVFPEAIASRIQERGGSVLCGATPVALDRAAREVGFNLGGEKRRAEYDEIVSTIPLRDLVGLQTPAAPRVVAESVRRLESRAVLFVNLCVNREEVFPCQWVYFTEKVFNRVSEITKFSPAVVPPGKTALSVELGCNRGDPLYAASDEEVYRRVVADLESLQVLKRSEIDDCLILRHPDAYPLYLIGYRESLAAVLDHFAADPCLHIGGRQGLFRYVNMDQAMEMGFGIAEKIRGKQEG